MNLVFFDIDGTLAVGKMVPESAQKALKELRSKDNKVFICTGRNVSYARANFHKYADGFICNNGRLAVMGDETLFDAPLSREVMEDIISRLDSIQAGYVFHTRDKGYYGGIEEGFDFLQIAGDPGYMTKGIDMETIKAYNFDVYFKDMDHRKQIEDVLDGICLLNPHGPHPTADMTVIGVDKGDALKHVASALGTPIENTYAFGDGINDLCMLKAAGHGVAMANGRDEVKAAAEYVTTAVTEDGVYNGLKHYGLIEG